MNPEIFTQTLTNDIEHREVRFSFGTRVLLYGLKFRLNAAQFSNFLFLCTAGKARGNANGRDKESPHPGCGGGNGHGDYFLGAYLAGFFPTISRRGRVSLVVIYLINPRLPWCPYRPGNPVRRAHPSDPAGRGHPSPVSHRSHP